MKNLMSGSIARLVFAALLFSIVDRPVDVVAASGSGTAFGDKVHESIRIYEQFVNTAKEGFGPRETQTVDRGRNNMGAVFLSLQDSLTRLRQIADKEPESSAAQLCVGLAAYDLAMRKTEYAETLLNADSETRQQLLPVWKLTDMASAALQKCVSLEPQNILAHQRLASLYSARKASSDHRKALKFAVRAAEIDPGNPQGVTVLLGLLEQTRLVYSRENQDVVSQVLSRTSGDARRQIERSLETIRARMVALEAELETASSVGTAPGMVDVDAIDRRIAFLESLKFQYPLQSEDYAPQFGGFLGGLRAQASDAGNFAARLEIERDIEFLQAQRVEALRTQSSVRQAVRERGQVQDRLERLQMIVSLLQPYTVE